MVGAWKCPPSEHKIHSPASVEKNTREMDSAKELVMVLGLCHLGVAGGKVKTGYRASSTTGFTNYVWGVLEGKERQSGLFSDSLGAFLTWGRGDRSDIMASSGLPLCSSWKLQWVIWKAFCMGFLMKKGGFFVLRNCMIIFMVRRATVLVGTLFAMGLKHTIRADDDASTVVVV